MSTFIGWLSYVVAVLVLVAGSLVVATCALGLSLYLAEKLTRLTGLHRELIFFIQERNRHRYRLRDKNAPICRPDCAYERTHLRTLILDLEQDLARAKGLATSSKSSTVAEPDASDLPTERTNP